MSSKAKRMSISASIQLAVFGLVIVVSQDAANAAGPSGMVRAFGQDVNRMLEKERALAPFASVVFCMKQPAQCSKTSGDDVMTLDERRKTELTAINSAVNLAIKPTSDPSGSDNWEVDVKRGDCEDFALTKRKNLIERGWSSASLRIAVALTPSGEGHAVLVAKTSEGDLVLDNRNNSILDWRRTDLSFLTMQSKDNPKQWFSIVGSSTSFARTEGKRVRHADPSFSTTKVKQASDIGVF